MEVPFTEMMKTGEKQVCMVLEKEIKSSVLERVSLTCHLGASLVAQCLRICLPMQRARVRALVQEDPTCCRAARPVRHNY